VLKQPDKHKTATGGGVIVKRQILADLSESVAPKSGRGAKWRGSAK
jgi:hypothetical protein